MAREEVLVNRDGRMGQYASWPLWGVPGDEVLADGLPHGLAYDAVPGLVGSPTTSLGLSLSQLTALCLPGLSATNHVVMASRHATLSPRLPMVVSSVVQPASHAILRYAQVRENVSHANRPPLL
eukprot:gene7317-437_t